MMTFKLKGVSKFMDKLNREIDELKGRTHEGLIEAAVILQREAEPETPIDLGNLRASWFIVSMKGTEVSEPDFKGPTASDLKSGHSIALSKVQSLAKALGTRTKPLVIFGYSANYAVFVHENVGASFKRSGARARWLFAAMLRSRLKMLTVIQHHARF